jgi:signal transduction histidine kinase
MNKTHPVRILLIEDNETDVMLLREAFADLGESHHEFIQVSRLKEGLDLLKKEPFDVLLLDLGLPDSQGVDTFVKLHGQTPKIPVLVLTALNDESAGEQAVKLGAQDYLIKNQMQPPVLMRSIRYAIERQRIQRELFESQQWLRNLVAYLQNVREAERTQIAREVHDELGQMLTALKMDLRWMEKKLAQSSDEESVAAVTGKIAEANQLANQTIEIMQRISLELRPSVLDNLGLTQAIRDDARRFEVRTGVKLKMILPEKLPKLKLEIATAFFRVFQELLTNVARHAKARNVTVRLAENGGELELVVQDDGTGLPADALTRRTSLGLLGMNERAISLGGRIQFEGAPGKGTSATLTVPIAQTNSHDHL